MNEVDIKTVPAKICKYWNKKSCGFGPAAEVILEVMTEVMSAETSLIKWSKVLFILSITFISDFSDCQGLIYSIISIQFLGNLLDAYLCRLIYVI